MLFISHIENPSVGQFQTVVHGMRNAFKSWIKNDSSICYGNLTYQDRDPELCSACNYHEIDKVNPEDENDIEDHCNYYSDEDAFPTFVLGKNDYKLITGLTKLGASDRKALRQLPVIIDLVAPEYFWRQLDQYKINTVTNSTSQMHTLLSKPFEPADFSFEYFNKSLMGKAEIKRIIDQLNNLRETYLEETNEEEKERLWFSILELIPQSFNYFKTWSGNYEVLLNIIQQRRNHPLPEWKVFIDKVLDEVPYLKELDKAINEN